MSTPEEKLNSPTHSGPARCTLEQLRARWGLVYTRTGDIVPRRASPERTSELLKPGDVLTYRGMGPAERWKVEKIEGKRVDLVQEER